MERARVKSKEDKPNDKLVEKPVEGRRTKYVAENRGKLGFNVLVFGATTNSGHAGGLDPNAVSAGRLPKNTPGLSLVIIEGHRVFQNQGLIEISDYIAWLTISPSSTGARRNFFQHLPEQIAHALREIS